MEDGGEARAKGTVVISTYGLYKDARLIGRCALILSYI